MTDLRSVSTMPTADRSGPVPGCPAVADRRLTRARLRAADGVRIDAVYRPPRPSPQVVPGLAVVVAHGFAGSWRRTAVYRATEALVRRAGVVAFDFRGHGTSAGRSTLGDREVLDLDAAVAWCRSLGYPRVATLGFSMGASVVVRHAALAQAGRRGTPLPEPPPLSRWAPTATPVEAAVAVSGPSRWFYRGTGPMRRLHLAVEHPVGRAVARVVLRTRVAGADWKVLPAEPRALAPLIAPTPLLVVHGDQDAYFPTDHAIDLYEAASEPRDLWLVPGFGHAENAVGPELLGRITDWIAHHAGGVALASAPEEAVWHA